MPPAVEPAIAPINIHTTRIILVDIGSNHSKSELRFEKDVYASPQVVMAIYSPSEKEFAQYVSRNAQVIVDFFSLKERERQI